MVENEQGLFRIGKDYSGPLLGRSNYCIENAMSHGKKIGPVKNDDKKKGWQNKALAHVLPLEPSIWCQFSCLVP